MIGEMMINGQVQELFDETNREIRQIPKSLFLLRTMCGDVSRQLLYGIGSEIQTLLNSNNKLETIKTYFPENSSWDMIDLVRSWPTRDFIDIVEAIN